jgi:CRISPR-associated protein Csm2
MNKYNDNRKNKNQHGQKNNSDEADKFKTMFLNDWISKDLMQNSGKYKNAIEFAEQFGKEIVSQGLTTSQIRNFFGEVRRIQMKGIENEKTAFLLLKPKLAYAAKRAERTGAVMFKDIVLKAHDVVMEAHDVVMEAKDNNGEFKARFKNFVDFLEAILAYHKVYGGK